MILPFPFNLDSSLTIQQHEIICWLRGLPLIVLFSSATFSLQHFLLKFFCIREIIFAKAFISQEDLALCCSYSLITFIILSKGFFLISFLVILAFHPHPTFSPF